MADVEIVREQCEALQVRTVARGVTAGRVLAILDTAPDDQLIEELALWAQTCEQLARDRGESLSVALAMVAELTAALDRQRKTTAHASEARRRSQEPPLDSAYVAEMQAFLRRNVRRAA